MKGWYQLYQRNISPETCEEVVKHCLTFPPTEGKVGHGGHATASDMRKSTLRWIPRYDEKLHWLFSHIVLNALEVNHNCFGLELNNFPKLDCQHGQFTEYVGSPEGGGKYDFHEDNCWIADRTLATDRKLSCVLQLTDPSQYEGGRLEFERPDAALPEERFLDQGSLIFFPSHLRHRVTPVTSGIRYSFVMWFGGPPFK
jgi:PKHD-type hydroxylase